MNETNWAHELYCSKTGAIGALDRAAFLSPAGAPWLVRYQLSPSMGPRWQASLATRPWTLWRYRELLPLADYQRRVDLGEGGTPLIRLRRRPFPAQLWVKEESGNPTGSFKARGLSLAVNRARELGAPGVQLASAGNAALATAAYAAAAGLPSRVALPADTPVTVARQCRSYGAEVLMARGTLVDAAALLEETQDDYWNLSTLREPYRVEGKKTMGLELAEQFDWQLPEWIVYPTGGGTGIIGMLKAFDELEALGLIGDVRPRFLAVQMEGCAPIVRAFERGADRADRWEDPQTRVWGLRVPQALGDFLILEGLRRTNGLAMAVQEESLAPIIDRVARQEGLLIGPEGAAALAGAEQLARRGLLGAEDRVVVFQTGHPANYI